MTPKNIQLSQRVRYALQDRLTLEKYPLRGVLTYVDAFDILEACRAGEDSGLLIPPRRGAELRIIMLASKTDEARQLRDRAAQQAHIDAEIASLFPEYKPCTATEYKPCTAEAFHRLLCRTDVTVLVLIAGAAALLLRRLL